MPQKRSDSIARKTLLSVLALLAISALVALAPLAYADPPDPTWVSGIWDDDDFDNVVDVVSNTLVGADPCPTVVLSIEPSSSFLPLCVESSHTIACPLDWFEGRAPPRA
jgi:hypothetical protein